MGKNLSLGQLTFLYSIGTLSTKVIGFVTFFAFTFYLSKEDLGYYDLILSSLSLVIPILSMQLNDSVLRWLMDTEEKVLSKEIISTSYFFITFLMGCLSLVVFIIKFFVTLDYLGLIWILVCLSIFFSILQFTQRGLNQNKYYIISGIIFSMVFSLSSIISISIFEDKISWLLRSNLLALSAAIIYSVRTLGLRSYLSPKYMDFALLKRMIRYSLPLVPNSISWWVILTANRYIIVMFLGISATGIFSVGMKFPSILLLGTSVFYMAWQERAIKSFNLPDRDQYYTKIFDKYFGLLFGLIAIAISSTKLLIGYIVEPSYVVVASFVPILYLSVGYQSLSSFLGIGYLSSKQTRGAFTSAVVGASVTILSSFPLIKSLDLIGASLAILLGYLTLFIFRVIHTRTFFKIDFNLAKFFFCNFMLFGITIATLSEDLVVLITNVIISGLFFIVINWNHILGYFKKGFIS